MNAPEIDFRYSRVYLGQLLGANPNDELDELDGKLSDYAKRCVAFWEPYRTSVPRKIAEISGINWREQEITCYIVGRHNSFSDPLSMKAYKDGNEFVDTLIHELIHRLFLQEPEKGREVFAWIKEKYGAESRLTRNHIPVHAIYANLYMDVFGKERLEQRKKAESEGSENKDYARSWEIVDKEGYNSIVSRIKALAQGSL